MSTRTAAIPSIMSRLGRPIIQLLTCLILGLGLLVPAAAQPVAPDMAARQVHVIAIDGVIGPATSAYLADGLAEAGEAGVELVVVRMDTPGGLDTSMREMIRAILDMPVPVVGYVAPSGARAASAGTYLLYASHVAAMTPGTNLGAATPIQLGGASPPPQGGEKEDGAQPSPRSAAERKAVNDAVAYLRSLAEMRGRNADWAEEAVREAASLSANAALEAGVIDIVARDLDDLLLQLDGRTVDMNGRPYRLETEGLEIVAVEPDWSTRLLATITNPNVALILLMVGVYGLFFEFMNPGALVPGTIGAIALLLALYSLAALPVDFAGIGLIVLGLALMVAEAFAPSFGILGLGGLVSFVLGAAIMVDTDVPQFQVDWPLVAALGAFGAIFLVLVARVGLRSRRRPVRSGREELIGARGEVADWAGGRGHVLVHSERWNATGPANLAPGAAVRVETMQGLELRVSALAEAATPD